MEPMFKKGDIVHIVDEPVELKSTWVNGHGNMDDYCGWEVEILDAFVHSSGLTGIYEVQSTETEEIIPWTWNDEAFKEFYVVIEEEDLLELLG